jgi:hypothetical protein
LRRALEQMKPDLILLEGPPDADEIVALAAHEEMRPPVAILVYDPVNPRQAVFYPFAVFSPEWQALQFGLKNSIPVRFFDLPQWHRLIAPAVTSIEQAPKDDAAEAEPAGAASSSEGEMPEPDASEAGERYLLHADPLSALATAAGFTDGERWWDYLLESRRGGHVAVFDAIAEAMGALREPVSAAPTDQASAAPKRKKAGEAPEVKPPAFVRPMALDADEGRREAWMRKTIRAAIKEGAERIAVVCGAWHVPALRDVDAKGRATEDAALLKGLPKTKTAAAWVPWSYDRLAMRSGYGAGVASPEWYHLLWSDADHVAVEWLTRAARLMRKKDLDVSSGHVIEATRLAEALAAMRGRPGPGLDELDEAALTVMCFGDDPPMALVRNRLVIGERLGKVPEDAPLIPLQADLTRLQKSLRLPARTVETDYDLDLRKELDLERSRLLHRLRLLGVDWGEPRDATGKVKGTFHELWRLQWDPELVVKLVDAGRWGNTIAAAADARAADAAESATSLAELTALLDDALLADLPGAVAALIQAIQSQTAVAADVPMMMDALPPLANVSRYGNVRRTDADQVLGIVRGLIERICVGLGNACASLDDDAARAMFARLAAAHGAIGLLNLADLSADWHAALGRLADQPDVHGLVAGRSCRLLLDARMLGSAEAGRRLSFALSTAVEPAQAAGWIEGFLAGSGAVLIHDPALWSILDKWVTGLSAAHFDDALPLLRRTFSTFAGPERRMMGERVKRAAGGAAAETGAAGGDFDYARADAVLPILSRILGIAEAN